MWKPKSLRERLQPKKTSKQEPTDSLSNGTKKRIERGQYEEAWRQTQTLQGNEMTACNSLQGDILTYVTLKFSTTQQRKTLNDTGACPDAINEKTTKK